ncbi:hypothetical protein NPX13_g7633 [Xylaria arbuscula]|uniref:Uncharacterized protein n=1 Tax=Xylaria arbuscula TaxID=114810 RepID=A0A9W8N9M6_9PEZI|nr:hypothetical protein NPX13_g7633 [Xylaria arbuscula]
MDRLADHAGTPSGQEVFMMELAVEAERLLVILTRLMANNYVRCMQDEYESAVASTCGNDQCPGQWHRAREAMSIRQGNERRDELLMVADVMSEDGDDDKDK